MCTVQFCTSPEVSDKSLYATFARTKPHDSQISMAVVSLLLKFNWTTIAFVYSDEALLLADALLEVSSRLIRPLSDAVPLWSGSSYRAFVYIGNDGFCFVNTTTVKNSVVFLRFPSKSKEFKKWEHLNRLNSLNDTNVIAIVNKRVREPHCVIWQMS